MGGAVTNLAAVKHGLTTYDPDVVQGTVLDRAEIDRQIELYRALGPEERRSIAGLQPNRAEVILAGACIVRTVLDVLGADSLTVSDRALRHGLIADRFKEETMSTTAAHTRAATDEELPRLLALMKDSDTVELKFTVPADDQRKVAAALSLDPLQAQIRQVFFLDTPDLALNKRGLVVRARRVQKRGDDSVVKLRPVVPAELRTSSAMPRTSSSRSTRCRAASSARAR